MSPSTYLPFHRQVYECCSQKEKKITSTQSHGLLGAVVAIAGAVAEITQIRLINMGQVCVTVWDK